MCTLLWPGSYFTLFWQQMQFLMPLEILDDVWSFQSIKKGVIVWTLHFLKKALIWKTYPHLVTDFCPNVSSIFTSKINALCSRLDSKETLLNLLCFNENLANFKTILWILKLSANHLFRRCDNTLYFVTIIVTRCCFSFKVEGFSKRKYEICMYMKLGAFSIIQVSIEVRRYTL